MSTRRNVYTLFTEGPAREEFSSVGGSFAGLIMGINLMLAAIQSVSVMAQPKSTLTAVLLSTRILPLKNQTLPIFSARVTCILIVSPGLTSLLNFAPFILVSTGVFFPDPLICPDSPSILAMKRAPVWKIASQSRTPGIIG